MKYEFKISRLAVVCALCASATCPAFGAASVRSLGGAGAYSGAASAAAAKPASGTNAARAGSMRVTTAQSKPVASTGGGSASAASASRLSIGKYLGGGTSVSGGSSIKNQATGGAGAMAPGLSAAVSDVKDLTARVENLEVLAGNVYDKSDVDSVLSDKQDRLVAKDTYVVVDGSEIYLDVDNLEQALKGTAGEDGQDGREVAIDVDNAGIKWQYSGDGDKWTYLASWEDLKGEKGDPGVVDSVELNNAVANAVAGAGFLTADDLEPYAKQDYVLQLKDTVGLKADADQVYRKDQVYSKEEVDSKVQTAVTGGVEGLSEVLSGKADKNYVDAQVAYVTGDVDLNAKALTGTKNLDKGQGEALLYDYPVRDVRVDKDGHTILVKYAPIGTSAIADNANIKVSQLEERVGNSLDRADNSVQKTGLVQYVNVGDTADYAVSNNAPSEKAVSQALANTASKADVDDLTELVELVMEDVDSKASKQELKTTSDSLASLTDDVLQIMEDVDTKATKQDVDSLTDDVLQVMEDMDNVYTKKEVDDKVAAVVSGDISDALDSVNTELAKKADSTAVPTKTSQLTNDSDFLAAPEVEDMGKDQVLAVYQGQKLWLDIKDEDKQ